MQPNGPETWVRTSAGRLARGLELAVEAEVAANAARVDHEVRTVW